MSEMLAFFTGPLAGLCILFLVLGIALMIVEMLIPGFGAPGIFGVICLISSIVVQFVGNTAKGALTFTAFVLVLLLILVLVFLRSFRNGKLSRSRIVNRTAIREEEQQDDTLRSVTVKPGMKGKAITPLRPAGMVEIEGKRVNAETDGTFLTAGTEVEVTEVKGLGIIVHEVL